MNEAVCDEITEGATCCEGLPDIAIRVTSHVCHIRSAHIGLCGVGRGRHTFNENASSPYHVVRTLQP